MTLRKRRNYAKQSTSNYHKLSNIRVKDIVLKGKLPPNKQFTATDVLLTGILY